MRSHGKIDTLNSGVLSGLRGLGTREGYWRLLQGHSVCVFELGSIGRVGEWMEADHDVFMIVRVLHRTLFLEFCTAGEFYSYPFRSSWCDSYFARRLGLDHASTVVYYMDVQY